MSVHVISWVLHHSKARLGDRLVLLVLADKANDDGTGAWPSVRTIAREARMSVRAVQYSLRRLELAGAIVATGTSVHGTTVYTVLTPPPANSARVQSTTEIVSDFAPEPSFEPSSTSLSSNVAELREREQRTRRVQPPLVPAARDGPMTPSRKETIIAAFETGDQLAIRRLGWWPVWEACSTWWAPRQTCTAMEFVPFAKLLGDEDPEKVLDALRDLCGDWRPTPAQVRGHLHRKTADESSVDVGRGRDLTATPEALQAVAAAIRAGEQPCSCGRRSPQWKCDRAYVLRCPDCDGLEHGQVFEVEDLERTGAGRMTNRRCSTCNGVLVWITRDGHHVLACPRPACPGHDANTAQLTPTQERAA